MSHSNVRKGILRYGPWARANHWIVAICFVLLTLSGLALFYPAFFGLTALFGGPEPTRIVHPYIGVFMTLKMLAVVSFSPIFMIPSILVAIGGYVCGNIYMKAQLSVKREMSKAKAPVLGHFGAAISGISECNAHSKVFDTNKTWQK